MVAQARRQQVVALALVGLAACAGGARAPAATARTSTTSAAEVLPFIHDDYPRALAEAKRTKRPLFVDAWAPWCHSCMSLKTYVLTDPALAPLAKDFVWLSVDTEKDVNSAWVAKYPHAALPTLWIIDPVTGAPLLKWAGTATAAELVTLLAAATSNDPASAAFVRGKHALASGDLPLAIEEHRAALGGAKADARPRVVEALVSDLSIAKDDAACAELAAAEAPAMPPGTSRASVLVAGLSCAREAKKTDARDRLLGLAVHDATERDGALLPDDRSAIYEEVLATKKELGDDAGARALAAGWASYLEAEAKKAPTKDARTALDPWRVAAYIATGEPGRAVPVLEESARDFPQDYNPEARLGRVYLVMGSLDLAAQATDRAIALVYGPRAMRVYELRADIAKARGDRTAEIRALEEALARSEAKALTQGQSAVRDRLVKRLAALR